MPAEYSFFRAEGESLSAIETVEDARRELEALKAKLCAKFGADEVGAWLEKDTGRFTVRSFYFMPPSEPPEGWVETQKPQMSYDKSRVVVKFAKPADGSPDHFHVASIAGLMERHAKNWRLEDVFGCGEMPMKDLPAGEYSGQFVRQATFKDPANRLPEGTLRDKVTMCFGSNSACRGSDLIDYMELAGTWYIRVPNKKGADSPQFIPPDAVPVSFEGMLKAERAELDKRNGPRSYPSIH
jgi:hypothetical protein